MVRGRGLGTSQDEGRGKEGKGLKENKEGRGKGEVGVWPFKGYIEIYKL